MRLNELKRSYHTIISLGSNCLPAYHLRRCELRSFSGPLDWMISDSLDTVATLLENRFSGFMELENLRVEGIDADQKNFLVRDIRYNIVAAHHFPTQANQWHQLTTYPFFAEQLKRRIDRLYQIFAGADSVLFIRVNGSAAEAARLSGVLERIVRGDHRILLIGFHEGSDIVECECGLEKVCMVSVPPLNGPWHLSNPVWDRLLSGITISA